MKQRKRIAAGLCCLVLCLAALPLRARAEDCDHTYVEVEETATCIKGGLRYYECSLCGYQYGHENTQPLGHDYGAWQVTVEASCEKEGQESRECVRCGNVETHTIEANGHSYEIRVVAPTCTKDGYTLHTCVLCGDTEKTDITEKTGHHYDNGVVTKEATLTAMGRITYTCSGCGDTYTETTPKLVNPFVDIQKSAYYFDAVVWAVNRGITSGTDETHFSPDNPCTRAQVVTFLWRSAGSPEPESDNCPFVDVPAGSYYRKAVLWAAEMGITSGIDATHFGPNSPCTRAQVVTFLYRAAGSPEWEATDRFTDVKQSSYYHLSVCWAADNGITSGVDGERFAPNQVCTRAQVVTFLYRADGIGE